MIMVLVLMLMYVCVLFGGVVCCVGVDDGVGGSGGVDGCVCFAVGAVVDIGVGVGFDIGVGAGVGIDVDSYVDVCGCVDVGYV